MQNASENRSFDDSILIEAIQPIYQLNWADVAEDNGESFPGCNLCEICPKGPDALLLAIAREWVARIEVSTGNLPDAFHAMGVGIDALDAHDTWNSEEARALYHVFMSFIGHGIGIEDYCYEWGIENLLHNMPFGEDCAVRELAEKDYASSTKGDAK